MDARVNTLSIGVFNIVLYRFVLRALGIIKIQRQNVTSFNYRSLSLLGLFTIYFSIFFSKIISFLFLHDWITCGHRNDNCWMAPTLQLLEIMLLLLFPDLGHLFLPLSRQWCFKKINPLSGVGANSFSGCEQFTKKIQLSNCVSNGIWFLFTLDYTFEEVVAKYCGRI